jgi:carboxymethylenebutenolidase
MAHALSIPAKDGSFPGLIASPVGVQPRGAIIVVQEAFGLTDHIGEICDRLALDGYRAIAPALYHRNGSPVFGYDAISDDGRRADLLEAMGSLSPEGIAADLDATIAVLAAEGFNAREIGVVGFCMGGSVAFFAATRPGISAAVTFYGGGVAEGRFGLPSLVDLASEVSVPWLGLYGDQDAGIPVDQVEALRSAARAVAVETEIVRYADAGHGFNCDARPDHFNHDAAADAWRRALGFFAVHLEGRLS